MKRNPILPILGILCGVAAIVFGIVMLVSGGPDMSTGAYPSYSYYGGDAYTGIQQASVDTARNVKTQSGILIAGFSRLVNGFGYLLLAVGLALIIHFVHSLDESKARSRYESAVLAKLDALAPQGAAAEPAPAETQEPPVFAAAEAEEKPEEAEE